MQLFLCVIWEFSSEEAERLMNVVWVIWHHKNQVVWEGKVSILAQVVFAATSFIAEWKEMRLWPKKEYRMVRCSKWHPPQELFVEMNVKRGFLRGEMQMGIGYVLRDWNGECIAMHIHHHMELLSAREGEAWGVYEALCWVVQLGGMNLVLEIDARDVTEPLR